MQREPTPLHESERMKIKCGEKHFEEFSDDGVEFKIDRNVLDL